MKHLEKFDPLNEADGIKIELNLSQDQIDLLLRAIANQIYRLEDRDKDNDADDIKTLEDISKNFIPKGRTIYNYPSHAL